MSSTNLIDIQLGKAAVVSDDTSAARVLRSCLVKGCKQVVCSLAAVGNGTMPCGQFSMSSSFFVENGHRSLFRGCIHFSYHFVSYPSISKHLQLKIVFLVIMSHVRRQPRRPHANAPMTGCALQASIKAQGIIRVAERARPVSSAAGVS